MAEFQALLDFPPAPELNLFGKLEPATVADAGRYGGVLQPRS